MANIVFVQNIWADILGPMYISAYLKKNGHMSEIIVEYGSVNHLVGDILKHSPDIVCFYCTTGLHLWAISRAKAIKQARKNILITLGCPHPTYSPEVINDLSVDIVCRGESYNQKVCK